MRLQLHTTILVLGGMLLAVSGCQLAVEKRGEAVDYRASIEAEPVDQLDQYAELDTEKALIHFADFDASFRFKSLIPSEWRVEYIPALQALNVFDPTLDAVNALEQSRFFIRQFEANDFLTLSTVTIHSATPLTVNGHEAVQYDIEKKSSVANFRGQPAWRSERHKVVDVRFAATNPSVFYVFAASPDVDAVIFQSFLDSLLFDNDQASVQAPMDMAAERVTKKFFGQYITPEDSPIEPERFTGYHTGIDFEVFDDEQSRDVPVVAFCGGEILQRRFVSGYGGLLVQRCSIDDQVVTVYYGHVAVDSARVTIGDYAYPGQELALLGEGFSQETDGERKHLHFAIHKGATIELAGYVANKDTLDNWIDPLVYFSN